MVQTYNNDRHGQLSPFNGPADRTGRKSNVPSGQAFLRLVPPANLPASAIGR